jgi:hypothetical protein
MRQQYLKCDNSSRTALFVIKPWQHVLNTIEHLPVFWIGMNLSHCGAMNPQMLVCIIPEPRAQKNSLLMRQQYLKCDNSSRTALFVIKTWQHLLNTIEHLSVFWIGMNLSHCGAMNPQMLVCIIPEPCAQKNS